jgi:hypothetical protein
MGHWQDGHGVRKGLAGSYAGQLDDFQRLEILINEFSGISALALALALAARARSRGPLLLD